MWYVLCYWRSLKAKSSFASFLLTDLKLSSWSFFLLPGFDGLWVSLSASSWFLQLTSRSTVGPGLRSTCHRTTICFWRTSPGNILVFPSGGPLGSLREDRPGDPALSELEAWRRLSGDSKLVSDTSLCLFSAAWDEFLNHCFVHCWVSYRQRVGVQILVWMNV